MFEFKNINKNNTLSSVLVFVQAVEWISAVLNQDSLKSGGYCICAGCLDFFTS
jgi:hypothetical protein